MMCGGFRECKTIMRIKDDARFTGEREIGFLAHCQRTRC
jgi:hypothetical protein